ncbi:MAG: radical SAM protein [Myxococcota bacterium]
MEHKGSRYNIAVDTNDGSGDVLLFNTATSGLMRVDAETYGGVRNLFGEGGRGLAAGYAPALPEALDPETTEVLAEAGFVVPAGHDEVAILRQAYEDARKTRHLFYTIGTTMACNFACPYCFEEHRPEHMSRETAAAVREFILEQVHKASAKSVSINWFGGEPLLNADVMIDLSAQLVQDGERLGFHYASSVITNGALLTRDMATRLSAAGIGMAQVTIDGPRDVHDQRRPYKGGQRSYDRIMANLKQAHDVIAVRVRINIDQENRPHVRQLLRELGEAGLLHGPHAVSVYGGKLSSYTELVEIPGDKLSQNDLLDLNSPVEDELDRLEADAEVDKPKSPLLTATRGGCSAVREYSYVIGSRGQLFKCELGIHDDRQAVGSVHREHEAPPPRRPKQRRLQVIGSGGGNGGFGSGALPWETYNPYDNDKCGSCQFVPVCKSGCPKAVMDGTAEEDNEICNYWDDNIGELVRRLAAQ